MDICPYYKRGHCTNCDYMNEGDNAFTKKVESFKKELHMDSINEGRHLDNPFHSRNKAKLAVGGKSGSLVLGFPVLKKKSVIIRELENCPLHLEGMNSFIIELKKLLENIGINPYQINEKKGELKYIVFYQSESTKESFLRFVLRSSDQKELIKALVKDILSLNPNIKSISINYQPDHKAIIDGEVEEYLYGDGVIKNQFDDITLFIKPKGFFQVTSRVALSLYSNVSKVIKDHGSKNVLDLFCGVGGFGLFASKYCEEVVGVELNKEAIECANKAKEESGISNIEFHAQDAFEFLDKEERFFDTIIVNPPRRGLGKDICDKLVQYAPDLLVYSSCNPITLNRDIELMKESYEVVEISPYDMFPMTSHLEMLCILKRRS